MPSRKELEGYLFGSAFLLFLASGMRLVSGDLLRALSNLIPLLLAMFWLIITYRAVFGWGRRK